MPLVTPAPSGYPDWQRQPAWRTGNLLSSTVLDAAPGTSDLVSATVVNFAALAVYVTPSAGYGYVTVTWYADQGLSQKTGDDQWVVTASVALAAVIPVRAPYAVVSVDVTSSVSMTGTVYVAADNTSPGVRSYPVGVQVIEEYNKSLAAGANAVYPFKFVTRGAGWATFYPATSAGLLHVQMVTVSPNGGADQIVMDLDTPTGLTTWQFIAVDTAFGFKVTNNSTASAENFYIYSAVG